MSTDVSKWVAEEVLAQKEVDLLPLLALTDGGRDQKLLESMFDRLHAKADRFLEGVAYVFTSYAFLHYEKKEPGWFIRRKQMIDERLEDVPVVRRLLERREKEAREETKEEVLRNMLIGVVEARMPELSELAREQAVLIKQPEVLHALTLKLVTAPTTEEARRYLLGWRKPTRKKKSA
ncbi:MAG TPA: hypothetical protein VKR06_32550 [Ktedonosporobacter sp.]|nr:hypothetical protein [Ktedonosporobacter sp.]